MKRRLWVLGLVFLLAACNLANTDELIPTPLPPTETPSTSTLPEATLNAAQPTAIVIAPTQNADGTCERLDWVLYTVATGDTLSSIATRTGSTIDEIAQGNCLSDVNLIEVGQTLRVPRQPTGNVVVPTSVVGGSGTQCRVFADTVLGGTNAPAVAPAQPIADGCYQVTVNTAITISWQPPVSGLTEATFYRNNSTLPRPDVIGVDRDPSDGFSIVWNTFAEMPPSVIYVFANSNAQGSSIESGSVAIFLGQSNTSG